MNQKDRTAYFKARNERVKREKAEAKASSVATEPKSYAQQLVDAEARIKVAKREQIVKRTKSRNAYTRARAELQLLKFDGPPQPPQPPQPTWPTGGDRPRRTFDDSPLYIEECDEPPTWRTQDDWSKLEDRLS